MLRKREIRHPSLVVTKWRNLLDSGKTFLTDALDNGDVFPPFTPPFTKKVEEVPVSEEVLLALSILANRKKFLFSNSEACTYLSCTYCGVHSTADQEEEKEMRHLQDCIVHRATNIVMKYNEGRNLNLRNL